MAFNWLAFGVKVLQKLPEIQKTIQDVQHAAHGSDKKAAVLAAIVDGNAVAESLADRQLLQDPRVQNVLSKANDINVEVQQVIATVAQEQGHPAAGNGL